MKKINSIALLLFSVLFAGHGAFATDYNVTLEQARDIAAYRIAIAQGNDKYSPSSARLVYQLNNPLSGMPVAYFFNIDADGFAIVAGYKAVSPLIAFSEYDTLNVKNMPPAMRWWVESFAKALAEAQSDSYIPSQEVLKEWKDVEGHSLNPEDPKAAGTLMSTKWGQGDPDYPSYNIYCPVLFNQYSYTGCVQTALGQIVRYYEYPKVGAYSKTFYRPYTVDGNSNILYPPTGEVINFANTYYDHSLMPNKLTASSSEAQVHQVAQLLFHIGVFMGAEYLGESGTAAFSFNVPDRMKAYFKYKKGNFVSRSAYTTAAWMDSIRASIDRKAPVYYAGASPIGDSPDADGHAWVCDGYRPQQPNYVYFNWGWDGGGNGWFNNEDLSSLSVAGMVYSLDHRAIFNLVPPDDSNRYISVSIASPSDNPGSLYAAYPNPACYQVTIPFHLTQGGTSVLQVYDVAGRQMDEIAVNSEQEEVKVNVVAYPKGIYLYRLKGGSEMHKFIVQ